MFFVFQVTLCLFLCCFFSNGQETAAIWLIMQTLARYFSLTSSLPLCGHFILPPTLLMSGYNRKLKKILLPYLVFCPTHWRWDIAENSRALVFGFYLTQRHRTHRDSPSLSMPFVFTETSDEVGRIQRFTTHLCSQRPLTR